MAGCVRGYSGRLGRRPHLDDAALPRARAVEERGGEAHGKAHPGGVVAVAGAAEVGDHAYKAWALESF